MASDALQSVIERVKLRDVWLLAGKQETLNDAAGLQLETEWRHRLVAVSLFDVDDPDSYPQKRALRIELQVALRWLALVKPTRRKAKVSSQQPRAIATIEGQFAAQYAVLGELDDTGLQVFAEKNAYIHVWPYAREYLANTALRMNLPKCVLPAIQFARGATLPMPEALGMVAHLPSDRS